MNFFNTYIFSYTVGFSSDTRNIKKMIKTGLNKDVN